MTKAKVVRVLAALVLLVLPAGPAFAHKLKLFASAVGADVAGRVYFVGGGAAVGVPVRLLNSAGEVVATTGSSAPDGAFALELPYRDDFTLAADAQDGHVASFVLAASRLSEALPQGPEMSGRVAGLVAAAPEPESIGEGAISASMVEDAVARQLAPLSEQVDAMRDTIGLRDIIGGIGYIFGAFGVWALLVARRKKT